MDNHDLGQMLQKLSEILKDAECPMCHSRCFTNPASFSVNTLSADSHEGLLLGPAKYDHYFRRCLEI